MRLAADANVLLSAVLGGRAKVVLDHPRVTEVLTSAVTLGEVEEYAAELARRKRLPLDVVLMAVATLPVTVVDSSRYTGSMADAKRRIGRRDPDDVDILALAIQFRVPLWSNDNDFTNVGVEWFTTATLLEPSSIDEELSYQRKSLGLSYSRIRCWSRLPASIQLDFFS